MPDAVPFPPAVPRARATPAPAPSRVPAGDSTPTRGQRPEPPRRIAVRTSRCFAIIAVDAIARLEADDNYVVVWADRAYRHKATLDALCARLGPARFVRVHRSHAVNVAAVRELNALGRGEFRLVLRDGASLRTGRRYAATVAAVFGLGDERAADRRPASG